MGLGRVRAALARLGNPEARLQALHVAGTNGKGSTCAIAASCLSRQWRTGLYTSPHLVRVNERFKIDGEDISDEVLGRRVAEIVEVLGVDHQLTFFELGTLVAFWHFFREGVELAVLETGLGGRLDATTACVPLVTAITSIDLDHQEYLGTTIEAIAFEKAGIIVPGVPVVSSAQRPEALRVLEAVAAGAGAPLRLEGRDFRGSGHRWEGRHWRLDGLELPLRGPHQVQNLSVALACLEELGDRGFPLSAQAVRQGLRATRWPGRLEEFRGSPTIVLDGAHNPAGVVALVSALDAEYPGRAVHLVFGVFGDKDSEPMMRALFPRCAALYLTPIDSPRSRSPDAYVALARTLCPSVQTAGSAAEALEQARTSAGGGLVVVAGSLALVGEVRKLLLDGGALTR
jgi:dihydrofolate synthase/folylpolyglutamate synthase